MRKKKNMRSVWLEIDPPKKMSRADEQFWIDFEAEWEKGMEIIREERKAQSKGTKVVANMIKTTKMA
jgi:hypothetical protein